MPTRACAISGLGSLNGNTQTLPLLYQIDAGNPSSFHDITTGNSIGPTSGSPSYFPGPGFDLATGIGSPVGNQLIPALVGIPAVTSAAAASPNPATSVTTVLSVAATTSDKASNLTYTWAATVRPTGAAVPTFSVNGSNAASSTTATFSRAGTYTFTVTIADSLTGGSAKSSVSVSVVSAPSIITNPSSTVILAGGTATFTAAASGNPAPTVQWEVNTGSGYTNVTDGGVYSGSSTGTLTITGATAGDERLPVRGHLHQCGGHATTTAATLTVQTRRPERDHRRRPMRRSSRATRRLSRQQPAAIPLPACSGRSTPAAASPT